ncbi:MAG: hypothetical protein A3I75_06705 [Deltaproteobacteria bacterium RIFCSPLOWO2_02_FULL_50_16]|nr:MAG: hypothetical protein A2053_01020 [Deltaproteobacteria bacterium GWA2_50_8]OGQ25781.1 MAG: hypothetical protein A3B79_04595 [Deltaproteobacteria bacterium RIFCSPHIGHO2_02_FULL_50_15]OGQ57247.1 MAG: hypothetical protein A3I75_06705 [Deltaproteobacteria bacterium RIFCSPLOWO2_02_FULL_50_16]OGQ65537.1 MAG: hypothetical protein A3F89_06780 [Deltaproteobacteria bacterium RIFCSPLOWO2_12_FULL_50_11]
MEACLDANVFVSCLTPEEDHEESLQLVKILSEQDVSLFEPSLVIFEVVSVLRRKVLLKEITQIQMDKAVDLFFQLPLLLQWQDYILKKAGRFSRKLGLKNVYDSSYLAVAQAREIPLITLDKDFHKKGQKVYKNLFSVREYLRKI